MGPILILAILICSAGIVLDLVFPRLRPLTVAAGAPLVFVAAFFAWLVWLYPGVAHAGGGLAAAGARPDSPLFTTVLLVPSALPVVAFACLSVLWTRGNRR